MRYLDGDVEERDGRLVRYVFFDGGRAVRLDALAAPAASSGAGASASQRRAHSGLAFLLASLVAWSVRRRPGTALLPLLLAVATTCGTTSRAYPHEGTPIDAWPKDAVLYLGDHLGSPVVTQTGLGCTAGGPLFVASADYGAAGLRQVWSGKPERR